MMTRSFIGLVALVAAAGALACSAKPLDGPTTVQVHANRGWQPAGVRVAANQAFTIEYVAGTIRDREVASSTAVAATTSAAPPTAASRCPTNAGRR